MTIAERRPTISIYDAKLTDMRKLLADLKTEADVTGDDRVGLLLANAHKMLEELLCEFVSPTR